VGSAAGTTSELLEPLGELVHAADAGLALSCHTQLVEDEGMSNIIHLGF
jgi:hypothetical protein